MSGVVGAARAVMLPDIVRRVLTFDEAGASADGFHRSWIMLFPLGEFDHPEYGKLAFDRTRLNEIKRNFDARVRRIDIALDVDHRAGDEDSRATGWIECLELREKGNAPNGVASAPAGLWGRIRWTPYGYTLLKDQEYRYFSPEFGPWTDPETGKKYENLLIGGALTNRPFLKKMPAIALSDGVSTRPWGEVDKSKLPDSAFLDSKNRRLPIYEGTGAIVNGRYTQRGKLNIHGARAALAAIHGARSGKAMTGLPAGTASRLQRLLARYGGGGGDAASTAAASEGGRGMANSNGFTLEGDDEETQQFMGRTSAKGGSLAKDAPQDTPDDEPIKRADDGDAGDEYDELDDGGDDDMGMDDNTSGDDDEDDAAMNLKRGKKTASRKASEPRREGMTLRERELSRRLAEMEFKLHESETEKRARRFAKLADPTGESEVGKAFVDAYRTWRNSEGFKLAEGRLGEIDKLLTLAMKSVVDTRQITGASYDQENPLRFRKAKGVDGDVERMATQLALSEKLIQPGQTLRDVPLAQRERIVGKVASELNWTPNGTSR